MHVSKESGKRMCWHCEGYVAMHLSQCPYCQAFLQDPTFGNPYPSDRKVGVSPESDELIDPFTLQPSSHWEDSLHETHKTTKEDEPIKPFIAKESFAVLFLFFGMGLIIFGLFVAFFGDAEGLVLAWSRSKAFYYVLAGIPLIYKGYKSCSRSQKKNSFPDKFL